MTHITDLEFKDFSFGGPCEPAQKLALAFTSGSGHMQQGVWECGPGEFEITFVWDESLYVLEGKAEIENLDNAQKFVLEPGCLFNFERAF